MDIHHLARIDLNLLTTLHVLLEEGSVSATAERLYLTQPAISKSLSRLRDLFQDPLFTRSGRGLVPTPYARTLQVSLNRILGEVADLFLIDDFNPTTYQGDFNLAVNEFMDMALVPRLIAHLSKEAPGFHINTLTQLDHQLLALEKGDLDFVMNLRFSNIPPGYETDVLLKDRLVVFARRNHPLSRKRKPGLANVVEYPRVLLHVPDMTRLSGIGRGRDSKLYAKWDVVFETENLVTALATVARTDYLLHAPGLLQHFASKNLVFIQLDTEAKSRMSMEYCLVTHERVGTSAPHQWLRQRIIDLAQTLEI